MDAKERIKRTQDYLLASDLPEEAKDHLVAMLDASHDACNGSADKLQSIAEAQAALVCHTVRDAIRARERLEAAVAAHVAACPIRRGSTVLKILTVVVVAAVAPNAGKLIELAVRCL